MSYKPPRNDGSGLDSNAVGAAAFKEAIYLPRSRNNPSANRTLLTRQQTARCDIALNRETCQGCCSGLRDPGHDTHTMPKGTRSTAAHAPPGPPQQTVRNPTVPLHSAHVPPQIQRQRLPEDASRSSRDTTRPPCPCPHYSTAPTRTQRPGTQSQLPFLASTVVTAQQMTQWVAHGPMDKGHKGPRRKHEPYRASVLGKKIWIYL